MQLLFTRTEWYADRTTRARDWPLNEIQERIASQISAKSPITRRQPRCDEEVRERKRRRQKRKKGVADEVDGRRTLATWRLVTAGFPASFVPTCPSPTSSPACFLRRKMNRFLFHTLSLLLLLLFFVRFFCFRHWTSLSLSLSDKSSRFVLFSYSVYLTGL